MNQTVTSKTIFFPSDAVIDQGLRYLSFKMAISSSLLLLLLFRWKSKLSLKKNRKHTDVHRKDEKA